MRKIITIAILLASTSAFAQTTPTVTVDPKVPTVVAPVVDISPRIEVLLSGYEYFPTRADLDKVGDAKAVITVLVAFSEDDTKRPTLRLRAVDALGYYDNIEATAFLESTIVTATPALSPKLQRVHGLLRHHAITSIARAKKQDATAILKPLLTGADVQLKMTAISAVAKHFGSAAKPLLEQQKAVEKNPVVRKHLHKFVR